MPEPPTLALFALGVVGLPAFRKRDADAGLGARASAPQAWAARAACC
ncbi:MAG: PEP-CTERM sorting domain-containing protein [Terriglobales bacterium]